VKKVPRSRLSKVVAGRLQAGEDVNKVATEIAAYLLDENRVGELDSLLRDVQQYRADAGTVEVLARSAHPLTDSVKSDIEAQVRSVYPGAQQIIITELHDESVIGGVKLQLAHEQLDLTVRSKLNRFKQLTAVGD
jgi:F0F1-type ATP synthase delta subunit